MSGDTSGLVKKTGVYAIGTFGSKILTFLLVPLYSYYLNKESFGYYDLIITTVNLAVPFLTLQISDAVFRWLMTAKTDSEKTEAITIGSSVIGLGLLVIGVIGIVSYLINPLKSHIIVFVLGAFAIIYPYLQQITRGLGYSRMFATNGLVFTALYLIGSLSFLVIFKLGINALLIATVLAYIFSSMLIVVRLKLWNYFERQAWSLEECRLMLQYCLPLVPNTVSWWLINSAHKYIILAWLGVGANGVFAMSNRFPVILVMVNQVFTLAWQESAIRHYGKEGEDSKYRLVLEKLIIIQFALVIFLTLSSQLLVSLLLSNDFEESWRYMPLLYLSSAFLTFSSFYGAFYLGAKKTRDIFTTTIYGGGVSIGLSILLVPHFELHGIAFSSFFGFLLLFVLRVWLIRRKKIVVFDFPAKTFVIYFIMSIGAMLVAFQEQLLVSTIGLAVAVVIIFVLNRSDILTVVHILKRKFLSKPKFNLK